MARPCLDRNAKYKALIRRLNLPRPYVRGLLETLWDVANECGNPVIGSDGEVEAAAEWPGEQGVLLAALVEGVWIEKTQAGKWQIHDYWDHAPEYVKTRQRMERWRKHKRAESQRNATECDEQLRNSDVTVTGKFDSPAPAPAPNSELGVPNSLSAGADEHSDGGNGKPKTDAPAALLRLIELWNKIPDVQHCRDATAKRIASFRQRSKRQSWLEGVKPALEKVAASAFCTGRGKNGWVADIDWFLKPDTVTRINEGKYGNRELSAAKPENDNMPPRFEEFREIVKKESR